MATAQVARLAILLTASLEGWHPVAYYSRKLNLDTNESDWTVSEAEGFGMHEAIMHWQSFLRNGIKFIVDVDHQALQFISDPASLPNNKRLQRIVTELQEFEFEVFYKQGSTHLDADFISRLLRFEDRPTYEMKEPEKWFGALDHNDLRDVINLLDLLQNTRQQLTAANTATKQRKVQYLKSLSDKLLAHIIHEDKDFYDPWEERHQRAQAIDISIAPTNSLNLSDVPINHSTSISSTQSSHINQHDPTDKYTRIYQLGEEINICDGDDPQRTLYCGVCLETDLSNSSISQDHSQ